MKLGTKIGGGFGVLLIIAAGLSGLAMYNMYNTKEQATKVAADSVVLATEFIPEVKSSVDCAIDYGNMMMWMRTFGASTPSALKG